MRLVQTIPLPHVKGRIDHLAVDVAGQRLFIAALGNNSLEVIDRVLKHGLNSLVRIDGNTLLKPIIDDDDLKLLRRCSSSVHGGTPFE